jgi:hypothetical protein
MIAIAWIRSSVLGSLGPLLRRLLAHNRLSRSAIASTVDPRGGLGGCLLRHRHPTCTAERRSSSWRVRFISDGASLHRDTLHVRGQLHAVGRQIPLELDATVSDIDGELEIESDHRERGMT